MIPGDYKGLDGQNNAFYQYVDVYCAASTRSYVSSAKFAINERGMLERIDGEDLGWDIFEQEIKNGVERDHRSVSVRVMNAFTVLHLANYHLVVVEDEHGNPKTYTKGKKAGEFVMNRVACTGNKCELCDQKAEIVYGKRLHWSVGQGHLEQIGGFAKTISSNCANCFGNRDLPDDGENTIADPNADPLVCATCDSPAPIDIFDCNISVKREGEGSKSALHMTRWKKVDLDRDDLKEMAKPWNFVDVFAPDPVEVQAKLLRLRMPPAQARSKQARDYTE